MSRSRLAGSAGGEIEGKLKSLGVTIVKPHALAVVKGREGRSKRAQKKHSSK